MLTIELVPRSLWFKNLRSELSKKEWDKVRRIAYKHARYECEICGGKGKKWPVEAHEVWAYDDVNKIQKLKGIVALCPLCHKVKHAGLAITKGELDLVLKQLAKVNEWSLSDANYYIESQFELWKKRNKQKWIMDITFLNKYLTN